MSEKTSGAALKSENEKKKSGGCLVILLAIFLTPLIAIGGFYALNREFRLNVNGVMSNVPGGIGNYFSKFPTKAEERAQVRTISEHFITLQNDRAVDKLLVLKSEDRRIYDEVVQDMLRINPNKTRVILESIRGATVDNNVLVNTIQRIAEESEQEIKDLAASLSTMSPDVAVEEVMKIISSGINGHIKAAEVLNLVPVEQARAILYQMDAVDQNRIFAGMDTQHANAIKNAQAAILKRQEDLIQMASVYKSEVSETLLNTIGNTNTYTVDELAVIYKHLGPKKAGEILSKVENESLVFDIVSKVKENEMLSTGSDKLTPDMLKSLKIYKEFDDNIKELVSIYSKMPNNRVAEVVRNMLINAAPSKIYDLDNGELIRISDEDVVLALLRGFPSNRVGELLTLLDGTLSTELSRQLALPKN